MPASKLVVRPGIDTQKTPMLNEGGWSSSGLIRFKDDMLEKLGGWAKLVGVPFTGSCRGLLAWADLNSNQYLAGGTDQRLQVLFAGSLYDITPIRATSAALNNALSSVISTSTVTVHDVAHNAGVGDWVHFVNPMTIGGIVLVGFFLITAVTDVDHYVIETHQIATSTVTNGGTAVVYHSTNTSNLITVTLNNHGLHTGEVYTINLSTSIATLTLIGDYAVQSVTDTNNFVIDAGGPANATTTVTENSGHADVEYILPTGLNSPTTLPGFGTGPYGIGPYGIGTSSGAETPLRQWSLSAWGEDLIANPTNGGFYIWEPGGGLRHNPATALTNAPTHSRASFIAMPQRQIISLGSDVGGIADPLLIRWCDVDDNTTWIADSINQAGSYRIPRGSKIIGGLQGPQQALAWTDLSLWVMSYIGYPLVYGFTEIGQGCGLIAARAAGVRGNRVQWMSTRGFFQYGGAGVERMPCSVWDKIFKDLDLVNVDKIHCAMNSSFNESVWHYPSISGGTGEADSYVKVNDDGQWDYGKLDRLAWIDQSIFGPPVGVDKDGFLQQHEISNDADGAPMSSFAETGWFKMADGYVYIFLERLMPDFIMTPGAQVKIWVSVADFPTDKPKVFGPYLVTPNTKYIIVRARGRLAKLKIESSDLGSFWRLGEMLYFGAAAGKIG